MLPHQLQPQIMDEIPAELSRHLEMVSEATLLLSEIIPLRADRNLALNGAAVHDLAKVRFLQEINGPGNRHAEEGEEILLEMGLPPELAAFAPGHMFWDEDSPVEHLLVSAADVAWKGARSEEVEGELARRLCESGAEEWEAWATVDEAMSEAGKDGPSRLHYQRTGERMQTT